jgi:hypothetical protein
MARKLSRRSQQRVAKNLALLESINTFADSISEEAITDLVRRDAIGIGQDGLPKNSMPEFSSGGGTKGSSTETAALTGLPGVKGGADDWRRKTDKQRSADVVRKQLKSIEDNLRIAHKALKEASFEIHSMQKKTEETRGRQVSTPCSICGLYAAAKAGWCTKDYEEWIEDGRPDRTVYEMWRRQDKNFEGIVLVQKKPRARSKT